MNITIEQLIEVIKNSTFKYTVAVKSSDYDSRPFDIEFETVYLINPNVFIDELENLK